MGAQGRPDLHAHAVWIGAEEAAQPQVLFDPAKEQLDFPAMFVDERHSERIERKLIGQEDEPQFGFGIDIADAPQRFWIAASALRGVESDGLIATQAGGRCDRSRRGHVVAGVGLEAGDEESTHRVQPVQARKIEISTIHHVIGTRTDRDLVERGDFVPVALVQAGKGGQIGPQIQQHVELHRRLRALPAGPRKQRKAQLDQRRIQREQIGVQVERRWIARIHPSRPAHQHSRHFGEQAPVAMLVRVSQIAAFHRAANSGMIKQPSTRIQTDLDVAQALAIGELCEDHRGKVIVSGKRRSVATHWISRGATRKLFPADACEHLGQSGFAGIHPRNSGSLGPRNQIDDTSKSSLIAILKCLRNARINLIQTAVGDTHKENPAIPVGFYDVGDGEHACPFNSRYDGKGNCVDDPDAPHPIPPTEKENKMDPFEVNESIGGGRRFYSDGLSQQSQGPNFYPTDPETPPPDDPPKNSRNPKEQAKNILENMSATLKKSLCESFLDPNKFDHYYGIQDTEGGFNFYREFSLTSADYANGQPSVMGGKEGPLIAWNGENAYLRDFTPFTGPPQPVEIPNERPTTRYYVPVPSPSQMIDGNLLTFYYQFHTHPNDPGGNIGLSDADFRNLGNKKNFVSGGPAGGYPVFGGAFDGQTKRFYGAIGGKKYDMSFRETRKVLGCK